MCLAAPNFYLFIPILYVIMAVLSFISGQYFIRQTKILFERGEVIWKTINIILFCFLLESLPILILVACDDYEAQKIGIFAYLIFIIVFTVIGILLGLNNYNVIVIVIMELAMCMFGLFFIPEIVSNILKIRGWKK